MSSLRILASPRLPYIWKPVRYLPFRTTRFIHPSPPFYTKSTNTCPSCSSPLPTPLPACTTCWYISPLPSTVTLHEIFGLPSHPNPFIVDISNLKQRFRESQAICHPDSWASKGSVRFKVYVAFTCSKLHPKHKQDVAQALSARVNEAYQCLLKPLSRAEYILERNQHPISENESLEAMEFITEIMKERERIDDANGPEQLMAILMENDSTCRFGLLSCQFRQCWLVVQPRFGGQ